MNEADVTRQIRDLLRVCRIPHWKIYQTLGSFKGMSDIIGIIPTSGHFLAIEVKAPGWNPPGREAKSYKHYREQADFIDEVNRGGGIGFFANSVDVVLEKLDLMPVRMPLFGTKGEQNATEKR